MNFTISIKDAIEERHGNSRAILDRIEVELEFYEELDELEDVPRTITGRIDYRRIER